MEQSTVKQKERSHSNERRHHWEEKGNLAVAGNSREALASGKVLSDMGLNGADMLDLSFLQRLEEERKTKAR